MLRMLNFYLIQEFNRKPPAIHLQAGVNQLKNPLSMEVDLVDKRGNFFHAGFEIEIDRRKMSGR